MKHLADYNFIYQVLSQVYAGKNLNDLLSAKPAKVKSICYGILRNYYLINFYISKIKLIKAKKNRIVLQIAIFEILYTQKPYYAITNDLVEFSYLLNKSLQIKRFTNWFLREFIKQKNALLSLQLDLEEKFNLPLWLINKLKEEYPKNYKLLANLNYHPAFGLRVNNRKIDFNAYLQLLKQNNIKYQIINHKLCLDEALKIDDLPGFYDGVVSIQDLGAQYTLDVLKKFNIQPTKLLDACSAPGGKLCQILENYNLNAIACDINPERLEKVKQNLERLELRAKLKVADVSLKLDFEEQSFDFILADVPCSAIGTIKRNPDIKLNRDYNDITKFAKQQQLIVKNLWQYLKNNGYLLYITCSILSIENQANVSWVKNNLTNVELVYYELILPTTYNDGLFYALFKKIAK